MADESNLEYWNRLTELFNGFSPYQGVEIFLLCCGFYLILAFLKYIGGRGIIKYLVLLWAVCLAIYGLRDKMPIAYAVISVFITSFIIIFCVVYISDLRRLVWRLSAPKMLKRYYNNKFNCSDEELMAATDEIVKAVQDLAKTNTGALIVLVDNELPKQISGSGTKIDATVSAPLLEAIFFKNSALHDGAVIINGNKVISAGCLLPLSQNTNLPKEYGTRHRAALGISEDTNTTTIIVSEETGIISVAKHGELARYYDTAMLKEAIGVAFGLVVVEHKKRGRRKG